MAEKRNNFEYLPFRCPIKHWHTNSIVSVSKNTWVLRIYETNSYPSIPLEITETNLIVFLREDYLHVWIYWLAPMQAAAISKNSDAVNLSEVWNREAVRKLFGNYTKTSACDRKLQRISELLWQSNLLAYGGCARGTNGGQNCTVLTSSNFIVD